MIQIETQQNWVKLQFKGDWTYPVNSTGEQPRLTVITAHYTVG
jgi:hypothetical protein